MKKFIFSALLAGGILLGQSAFAFPTYSDEGNPPCDGFSDDEPCGTPPTAEEHQAWLDAGADQVIAIGSRITEIDIETWSITNLTGGASLNGYFEGDLKARINSDLQHSINLMIGRVVLDLLARGLIRPVDARVFFKKINALDQTTQELMERLDVLEGLINSAATKSDILNLQQQLDQIRILIIMHRH